MNPQQHNTLADCSDAVAAWLLGDLVDGLGRLIQFLEQLPAGIHADPIRVRVKACGFAGKPGSRRPMPVAQSSRNGLNSSYFRQH
ncbi:MAG: hypothetical protein AAGC72_07775 [Planctomycetota bacterium]